MRCLPTVSGLLAARARLRCAEKGLPPTVHCILPLLYVLVFSLKAPACFSTKPPRAESSVVVAQGRREKVPRGTYRKASAGATGPPRPSALAPPRGGHAGDLRAPSPRAPPRPAHPDSGPHSARRPLDLRDCRSPSRSRRPRWPRRAAAPPPK